MSNRFQREDLLRDILAEEAPMGFRTDLRDHTLRMARRRRRVRGVRVVAIPCILVLGFCLLSWRWLMPVGRQPMAMSYTQVRTESIRQSWVIESRPMPAEQLIDSASSLDLLTTAGAGFRAKLIDDDELLELAGPGPAILIRRGANESELMIAGLVAGRK